MHTPISKLLCMITLSCTTPLYANSNTENQTSCQEVKFLDSAQAWAGHYYLHGVMEVGSELLLEPNGKFKWYLAVGSLDQYAEGTWWKNGDCIGLKALPKYSKQLEIFPNRLDVEESHLSVTWMGGRQDGTYIRATQ
ncbi:hypothetical protein CDG62_04980 [Acinetobacter sp. WCHA55]|uniref:hypothetical protein n=1 Tax=Acinetobacter sp. WCHA55 TaxID=2004646 RepID=UPI000B3CC34F|nr:hypothetical protein [Acinetobacter sp. WCHA55]AYA70281.1 hypothetical protein CDG62_04980 [Acinetobacter sp. WCHA55]